jgi:superfamily I DNA/RNA helicase
MLAEQFSQSGPVLSVAERAEADRSWAFGHLVVDEAQELSPMTWRLLARRCPARSWTVVGDLAQRGSAAGASSWDAALDAEARGRWRERRLTVSYRTPARVLAVADALAHANGLPVTPVQAVREGDVPPVRRGREAGDAGPVVDVVRELLGSSGEGTVAVVAPWPELPALRPALDAALPGQVGDARGSALAARVSLLAPEQVKGLEFDDVVVVEPAAIVAASGRGLSDLYVALSRPTRRLVVVHSEPLPPGMDQLPPG